MDEARRRGVPFGLRFSDVVWPDVCPILGIRLNYFPARGYGYKPDSASFDRINPNKGYVPGNVQIISMRANRIKDNASLHEIRAVADWMEQFVEECL